MVVPAGRLGLIAEDALIDRNVVVIAQVRLNNVIQFHAVGRPGQERQIGVGAWSLKVECPTKHAAHVLTVIGLAALFRLLAEHPLINPNIPIVSKVRLHDVIQIDARSRPLRQRRGRHHPGGSHRQRGKQNRSEVSHVAPALPEKLVGWRWPGA